MNSSLIPLLLEKIRWYDFHLLKLAKTCYMTYHMIYPGEWSMCAWEECVFCFCWMECFICLLGSLDLKYGSSLMFPYWFSAWMICHCWKWGIEVPTIITLLSLSSDLYLLNIFRYSNVECTYIYNCHIFLINWPLLLYNDLLCLFLPFFT